LILEPAVGHLKVFALWMIIVYQENNNKRTGLHHILFHTSQATQICFSQHGKDAKVIKKYFVTSLHHLAICLTGMGRSLLRPISAFSASFFSFW
jgi:hypothetical protein